VVDDDTIILKRPPSKPAKNLRGLLARPGRALSVEEMDVCWPRAHRLPATRPY
jgi:hypothetical protein